MKIIEIVKRNGDKYNVQVDDEDYEWLNQWKWHLSGPPNRYAVRTNISKENGKYIYKSIFMHRELLKTEKENIVDHIDRNSLNNQKHNLRIANNSQNAANRNKKPRKNCKYIGIQYKKWKNTKEHWVGIIKKDNKYYNTYKYYTQLEAAMAYNELAKKYHGEFAILNIFTTKELIEYDLILQENIKNTITKDYKKCPKCTKVVHINDFIKNKNKKGGFGSYCLKCGNDYGKATYYKRKTRIIK